MSSAAAQPRRAEPAGRGASALRSAAAPRRALAEPPPERLSDGDARSLYLLREHGDHSSAFLAFNDDTQHFATPRVEGLLPYRTSGRRHVVQLCGPLAACRDRGQLLDAFVEWAHAQRRTTTAVQVRREDVDLYASRGFAVDQLGASYSIDLDGYALRGQKFVKTRNMISRARREGASVVEVDRDAAAALEQEIAAVDADWLGSKGRHVQELAFMIGQRGGRGGPFRRTFVAWQHGRVVGYVSYSPCFGSRPGWLYDLTRRRPDAPPGTIEIIFHTALQRFQEEGWRWLHLGLTPFAGLSDERHPGGSAVTRLAVSQIARRGQWIYPSRTQESFKRKWLPQVVTPEYIAFERGPSLGAVWQLLRLTRTIP